MAASPAFRLLDLPMELHDLVLSHMEPEALISYTLAAYPHLASRRQRLGDYPPVLTRASVRRVTAPVTPPDAMLMTATTTTAPRQTVSSLAKQPSEMLLLFMRYLSQRDVVAFALGEYRTLAAKGIAPWPVGMDVIHGLQAAVLRGG